jgi:hypothetical protein
MAHACTVVVVGCARPDAAVEAPPRAAAAAHCHDPPVAVLAAKVLLAPAFVVGASLATRRYGAAVGGVLAGLPVVAGPILAVYYIQHGRAFAANAAAGTLLGIVSLTAFAVVFGRLATRAGWLVCMLAGWLAFFAVTAALDGVSVPAGAALVLALAALGLGAVLLPRSSQRAAIPTSARPPWDLPVRACCALALVLALTTASGWIGPQLSGLLAPFPVITTVLAAFTHAQLGAGETVRLLRSILGGFVAFALFCFALTIALRHLDAGSAFVLAAAVALLAQCATLGLVRRRQVAITDETDLAFAVIE